MLTDSQVRVAFLFAGIAVEVIGLALLTFGYADAQRRLK
jgi:hypothetical protein